MRFSVIVPVYNKAEYIGRCIESVLNQSYDDWELIIINDGSKDESGHICESYKKIDQRVKYFDWDNHGVILSRQKGIALAIGEYIIHLDADDYWCENLLEVVDKKIREYHCDILQYGFYECKGNEVKESGWMPDKDMFVDNAEQFMKIVLGGTMSLVTKVFKRELLIDDVDAYTRWRNIKLDEDTLQVTKPLCKAKNMLFIPDTLYNYVIIENSMAHENSSRHILDSMTVVEAQMEILKECGCDSETNIEKCYVLMLRTVTDRYIRLFENRCGAKVRKQTINEIRRQMAFQEMKRYEKVQYVGWHNYCVAKIFRYRLYVILQVYTAWKRVRRNLKR